MDCELAWECKRPGTERSDGRVLCSLHAKRLETVGQAEPYISPPKNDNEGVGPERTAELRSMFLAGTLGDYCDRLWETWADEFRR